MRIVLPIAALALVVGCSKPAEETPTTEPAAEKPAETAQQPTDSATEVTFAQVEPILSAKCVMCHGVEPKEEVDLRTYDGVMKGGEHGAIVVAGKPEESALIHVLRGSHGKKRMPLNMDPLSEEDIAKFEAWIKAGAKS